MGRYTLSEETLLRIDEDLRDVCKILDDKNYRTIACCSGHMWQIKSKRCDYTWNAHIYFNDNYHINPIKYFNNNMPYLLQGGSHGFDIIGVYQRDPITRKTKETDEKKEADRLKMIEMLTQWANDLPTREIVKTYNYIMTGVNKRTGKTRYIYVSNTALNEKEIEEIKEKKKRWYDNIKYKACLLDER